MATQLITQISGILTESGMSEFKLHRLKGRRELKVALQIIDLAMDAAERGLLRIDVLTWDTSDSRHCVPNRDDAANLARLYYRLIHNVLTNRHPKDAVWRIHADDSQVIDWDTLGMCLRHVGVRAEVNADKHSLIIRTVRTLGWKLIEIVRVDSQLSPIVQMADLFGGIANFAADSFKQHGKWESERDWFAPEEDWDRESYSNRDRMKHRALSHLEQRCRHSFPLRRLDGRLHSFPYHPINFWPYVPQHELDKAPSLSKRL